MVRLGMTNNSGRRQDGRIPSHPESEQNYPHTSDEHIRNYTQSHYIHSSNPRNSSFITEENQTVATSSRSHYSSNEVNESVLPSHPFSTVLNRSAHMNNIPSDWSHKTRPHSETPSRGTLKPNSSANTAGSSSGTLHDGNYTRDIKFCPVCRSSVVSGTAHHCKYTPAESSNLTFSSRTAAPISVTQHTSLSGMPHQPLTSQAIEEKHSLYNALNKDLIQSKFLPDLHATQDSFMELSSEKKNGGIRSSHSPVRSNIIPQPSINSPVYDVHSNRDYVPPQDFASEGKSSVISPTWSGSDTRRPISKTETWETPTSLISRLTAGLTACSSQQQHNNDKASSRTNCPSPSMSEESDSLSYSCIEESAQAEDPFLVAHQELMDEVFKGDPHCLNSSSGTVTNRTTGTTKNPPCHKVQKDRKVTSENISEKNQSLAINERSSDSLCIDTILSKESDVDNYRSSERGSKLPDLPTLLKSIKDPSLIPYTPDKSNIKEFLCSEEIGHINHLIKCLSDSVLTISLPDTLYKNKGFTPLDYMDIHLNATMRQFFFVFKSEDFLNLPMDDQISLLNGCSLRAVICSGLYLFSKDTGCWYVPGSTSRMNHPVIHISDLLQVYPQHMVSKMYELHTAASKLDFDWSVGVITNCILMYTPIKQSIQEMEKVDFLRNKYVHLLLKYVSWKHGQHNAALIFPEILKILDALVLLVDELSVYDLNLSEDEMMAVEERLSTLTLKQLSPHKNQYNSRVKEEIASWSSLKCINLTEINNRLCMVLHLSLMESVHSNTAEYWTSSSVLYNNASHDDTITANKRLPQILAHNNGNMKNLDHKENYSLHKKDKFVGECGKIALIGERDLMLLRQFLEDVTGRETSSLIEYIKEKMDAKQVQLLIKKLCS